MRKSFSPQERDAFAKAVSAVEGITFSSADDDFFKRVATGESKPEAIVERVLARALAKA
jgi:hypothetical protein